MGKHKELIEKLKEIKQRQKELDKLIDDVIELASQPDPPGTGNGG